MNEQLRELLRAQPFAPFSIEMTTGRFFNVYDPLEAAVTFDEHGNGAFAVAQGNAFAIVNPAQIVSIGPPKPPAWPGVRIQAPKAKPKTEEQP